MSKFSVEYRPNPFEELDEMYPLQQQDDEDWSTWDEEEEECR